MKHVLLTDYCSLLYLQIFEQKKKMSAQYAGSKNYIDYINHKNLAM